MINAAPGCNRLCNSRRMCRRSGFVRKCSVNRQVAPSKGHVGALSTVPCINSTRVAKSPMTVCARSSIGRDGSTPTKDQSGRADANERSSSPPPGTKHKDAGIPLGVFLQQNHRHFVQIRQAGHPQRRPFRIGCDMGRITEWRHRYPPNTRRRCTDMPAVTPSATAQPTLWGARAISPAA